MIKSIIIVVVLRYLALQFEWRSKVPYIGYALLKIEVDRDNLAV